MSYSQLALSSQAPTGTNDLQSSQSSSNSQGGKKTQPYILYCALRRAVLEVQGCERGLTAGSSALQKPLARSSSLADVPLGSPAFGISSHGDDNMVSLSWGYIMPLESLTGKV